MYSFLHVNYTSIKCFFFLKRCTLQSMDTFNEIIFSSLLQPPKSVFKSVVYLMIGDILIIGKKGYLLFMSKAPNIK